MGHLWKIAMLTYWMNGFTKMFHRWWLRTLWKVLPNSYTEPGRKRMIFACCYTYSLYENTKKKDSPYSSFLMFSIPKKKQKAEMKGNNPSFPPCFLWFFWAKKPKTFASSSTSLSCAFFLGGDCGTVAAVAVLAWRVGETLVKPTKAVKLLSMDWFCWENLNRKPMGFYHQIWWAFL